MFEFDTILPISYWHRLSKLCTKRSSWSCVMAFLVRNSHDCVRVTSEPCLFVDFYEEILTLVDTLTINTISPLMWQVFYLIKEAFYRDAADYFAGK